MPGILPMKVIKMGTTAQARIAQACDRCRSKKIKCDGIRPCCTQCASVGFECKTSDKLSRRAFPRGYTESLEERVRALEAEVRELKDLLDEKDEKLDILSKINGSRSPVLNRLPTPPRTSSVTSTPVDEPRADVCSQEPTFRVERQLPAPDNAGPEHGLVGASSAAYLLDSLEQKLHDKNRSLPDVNLSKLLPSTQLRQSRQRKSSQASITPFAPSRLLTDQLVNVFFQEWAPLFPVLHRPTFLSLYQAYTNDPDSITAPADLAQLHLVFTLAAISSNAQYAPEVSNFEQQWKPALRQVQEHQSLAAMQCLLLAQLACIQTGDCTHLLMYKSLAVAIATKLGLHTSQKHYTVGTLVCETRKRVFWTLYTIDAFSAVMMGLPKALRDIDISCEYPADADDEYITDKGLQPALPGEFTRVSSALALFRAARILSKVLEAIYPALLVYDVSINKLSALEDELNDWHASLPIHLRLPFAQDKPSVGTVSSRSPLLALTYHYIRSLIHRLAVCNTPDNNSSMLALAGSCKHTAQILALLTERGLNFSFCINKEELLVVSGVGLLLQSLELPRSSKVLRDNQKVVTTIIGQLHKMKAPSSSTFRKVACSLLPVPSHQSDAKTPSRHASDGDMPAPRAATIPAAVKEQFKAMTQKVGWFTKPTTSRRMTHARLYQDAAYAQSQPVMGLAHGRVARSEPARSPDLLMTSTTPEGQPPSINHTSNNGAANHRGSLKLDYSQCLPPTVDSLIQRPNTSRDLSDWERLLASIDNGQTNIYDNIYGGPQVEALGMNRHSMTSLPQKLTPNNDSNILHGDFKDANTVPWDSDLWAVTGDDLAAQNMAPPTLTESVFSLSSGDEATAGPLLFDDAASGHELEQYGGIILPDFEHDDGFGLWDGGASDLLIS